VPAVCLQSVLLLQWRWDLTCPIWDWCAVYRTFAACLLSCCLQSLCWPGHAGPPLLETAKRLRLFSNTANMTSIAWRRPAVQVPCHHPAAAPCMPFWSLSPADGSSQPHVDLSQETGCIHSCCCCVQCSNIEMMSLKHVTLKVMYTVDVTE
jgi:hypothetical protein